MGETIRKIRGRMEKSSRLIVCCDLFSHNEEKKLKAAGADLLIHPESWHPQHVMARILGEVILLCDPKNYKLGSFYGGSQAIRNLYHKISKVARKNYDLLILGETGTGKEVCSSLVHEMSGREGSFKAVNCATFSKELAASQ